MSLQRREFFAILGVCATSNAALFAQHVHAPTETKIDFAAYQPRALTLTEYELLDGLAETLLPGDESGPGAHDAHVAYYIDVVLTHGTAEPRHLWKAGLNGAEGMADQLFARKFAACSLQQRQSLMATLASNEVAPHSELDRFFVEFKRMAIIAFYASELIQREHLGYRGNTAVAEFAGCTHPDFAHLESA